MLKNFNELIISTYNILTINESYKDIFKPASYGKKLKFRIVDVEDWTPGKSDPTEYSYDDKLIRVRKDYWGLPNDPAGWLKHEEIHAMLPPDTSGKYPNNPVEEKAFKAQFKHLMSLGHKFNDIFKIPTMEHEVRFKSIFKRWWNEILNDNSK